MGVSKRLTTHGETAAWLHISEWTLHELCTTGRGPVRYKVGRHYRYDPAEVRDWLRTNATTVDPEGTGR